MNFLDRLFKPLRPDFAAPEAGARTLAERAALETCERDLRSYERKFPPPPSTEWLTPGALRSTVAAGSRIRLQYERAAITLQWLAADVVRLTAHFGNDLPAYMPPLAPAPSSVPVDVSESGESRLLRTGQMVVHVDAVDGRLRLHLADGTLAMTLRGVGWRDHSSKITLSAQSGRESPRLYGGGARSGPLDVRGQKLKLWNDPAHGMAAASPFLLLAGTQASAVVYWHDAARAHLDVHSDGLVWETEQPAMDLVLVVGTSPVEVVSRAAQVTGSFTLPPLWSFGFQCGGPGISDSSKAEMLALELAARGIPCSALHLGTAYQDGGRALTVDVERFPALREMVERLHEQLLQVVIDVEPGVRTDDSSPVYVSGAQRRAFVRYPDDQPVRAVTRAGVSVFPDFLDPSVRDWWAEMLSMLLRSGIDGIAHQASAPDIVRSGAQASLPDAAHHRAIDAVVSHKQVHNLYGMSMASAGVGALERLRPALRPYITASSAWHGFGHALSWTLAPGWEGVQESVRAALNGSLSGIRLMGVDVAADDGELQVRALQAAFLLPGLRGHIGGSRRGEPWAFGQPYELCNRLTLELRARLLPYLYACAAQSREYGVPIIRPLWWSAPDDAALHEVDDAYFVGDHLLVAPVMTAGARERRVRLPSGVWYDYYSRDLIQGDQVVTLPAPLEQVPLLVRAGAVIPHDLPILPDDPPGTAGPTLRVYPGMAETTLYEDPGEGYSHLHGEYRWVYLNSAWEHDAQFVLTRRKAGSYLLPAGARVRVEVIGLTEMPEDVRLDRHGAPLWYFDDGTLSFTAGDDFSRVEIWLEGSPQTPTRRRRRPHG